MKNAQQELPLPLWGGKRKGAGRKGGTVKPRIPHLARPKFRNAAVHVTLGLLQDVRNLRSRACFEALRQAFQKGCDRFGVRIIHFSVESNHIHMIVEAADAASLARAMKGLKVRMARALNKATGRRGAVFADRYHAHLLRTPREAANAVRYVLENSTVHARRQGWSGARELDPFSSAACEGRGARLVAEPRWWMLRVGTGLFAPFRRVA